jgi:hypothetical protein
MTERHRTPRDPRDSHRAGPDKDPMGQDNGVTSEPPPMSSADAQPAPPGPGGSSHDAALDPDAGMDVSEEATWRREHPGAQRRHRPDRPSL